MSDMLLSDRITLLMNLQNITKKQFCESLHIQPSTLSGYLCGKRQPSYDVLMRMAAYFNTSCDYLLGYSSKQTEETLTPEERLMLEMYRELTPEGKEMFCDGISLVKKHEQKGVT